MTFDDTFELGPLILSATTEQVISVGDRQGLTTEEKRGYVGASTDAMISHDDNTSV